MNIGMPKSIAEIEGALDRVLQMAGTWKNNKNFAEIMITVPGLDNESRAYYLLLQTTAGVGIRYYTQLHEYLTRRSEVVPDVKDMLRYEGELDTYWIRISAAAQKSENKGPGGGGVSGSGQIGPA